MATKIRLQRFGKKGKPFYHVVVADGRAPRDGKFIERIGSYNPNTNPATIDLNFDKALDWMNKGAQPTDTCRGILSVKGVLYKKHLQGGLKKGALTEDQVEAKFNEWLSSKEGKISGDKDTLVKSKQDAKNAALAAEAKKKEDRAAAIVAKNTPPAEEEVAESAETEEAPVAEEAPAEAVEEVVAEAPAAEETPEAEPAAEVIPEAASTPDEIAPEAAAEEDSEEAK
jgi:small subunit ribosomal protein S16